LLGRRKWQQAWDLRLNLMAFVPVPFDFPLLAFCRVVAYNRSGQTFDSPTRRTAT
jgi:hypothetical protein